jgi:hypothetical protein
MRPNLFIYLIYNHLNYVYQKKQSPLFIIIIIATTKPTVYFNSILIAITITIFNFKITIKIIILNFLVVIIFELFLF